MSTLHLVIICFTICICVCAICSAIEKVGGKHDSSKNRND